MEDLNEVYTRLKRDYEESEDFTEFIERHRSTLITIMKENNILDSEYLIEVIEEEAGFILPEDKAELIIEEYIDELGE